MQLMFYYKDMKCQLVLGTDKTEKKEKTEKTEKTNKTDKNNLLTTKYCGTTLLSTFS